MQSTPLEVTVARAQAATLITLRGDGSIRAADVLANALLPVAASRPAHVILDLSGLTFISSLVMGQLVALNRGLAAHGGMVTIAAPQEDVLSALKHARLDQSFEIVAELPRVASA